MPVPPVRVNPTVVASRFFTRAETLTGITNQDSDGKFKNITDILAEEMFRDRQEVITAFDDFSLTKAKDIYLERVGERIGAPSRRKATFAHVTAFERNVQFSVVGGGTFGSINGAASIVIPINTVISSNANQNEFGERIEYRVTQSVTLDSVATSGYVPVRAVASGSQMNVGQGVLRNHNFTGYVDAGNASLQVINLFPILNGIDEESDVSYRNRLALHYQSLLQNNEAKVRLERLNVPGVIDIKIIPSYFGVGTAAAIVLGAENLATPALLDNVQARLDSFAAPGLNVRAVPAIKVTFDFEIDAVPIRTLTVREEENLRSACRQMLASQLARISIGDEVSLDTLSSELSNISNGLVRLLDRDSRDALFKAVYVSKSVGLGFMDERSQVIKSTYQLAQDEHASFGSLTINFVS